MEKFKKQIAGLLIIFSLFLTGICIYQLKFSTFSSQNLQAAKQIKKSPQNIEAPIQNALLTAPSYPALRKFKKQRILSEREKYDKILNEHPFNNRNRKISSNEEEDNNLKTREEEEEKNLSTLSS